MSDWLNAQEDVISLLVALFTLGGLILGPLVFVAKYWSDRPKLVFRLEASDADDEMIVRITNIGKRAANDIDLMWRPGTIIHFDPTPTPSYIKPDESVSVFFSAKAFEILTHKVFVEDKSSRQRPLGSLEVRYRRWPFLQHRGGFSFYTSKTVPPRPVAAGLRLGKLPRRTVKELMPWIVWIEEKSGFAAIREHRRQEDRTRNYQTAIDRAREVLEQHGFNIADPQVTSDALLDALAESGWSWEFGPGDGGYEVKAEKKWYPSSSYLISMWGVSLLDAAVRTLACAIEEDERRVAVNQQSNVEDLSKSDSFVRMA